MTATAGRRILERSCWIAGSLLLLFYLAARVDGWVHRRDALRELAATPASSAEEAEGRSGSGEVDTSLWAEGRIRAYEESLAVEMGRPLAILRIPQIGLEVPVREGTDELTLNRGVGRIAGTARPGEGGNLGLAGHRDGFFRGLKDVEIGDVLELETPDLVQLFRIDELLIVQPEDVYVLDPTPKPSLTLVTCYPFYFLGKAPRRYVVRASSVGVDTF